MAGRRGRQPRPVGMVEERSGSWWVRVSVTYRGERRSTRHGPFATRRDAEIAQALLPRDQTLQLRWSRMTPVDTWILDWAADRVAKLTPQRREAYARSVERNVRLHLAPSLKGMTFDRLDPIVLDGIWEQLQRAGKSRATIRNVRAVMSSAMREARRQKLIDSDIVGDSPLESVHRGEHDGTTLRAIERDEVLDAEQVRRLRDWCLANLFTTVWAAPILFIIETAARRSEALGVLIEGIDLEARTVEIRYQISSKDGGLREQRALKSRKSRRTIGVSPLLIEAIRPLIGDRTSGLLFVDGKGCALDPESFSQFVRKQIMRNDDLRHWLGLPEGFSLHRLRHTHATLLLAQSVPVSVVAGRLGHSSPVVTQTIYTHFLASADMLAADTWSGIIHDA